MSQQLMALSASLELPYVRYERASAVQADDHAGDICNSMDEAARLAIAGSQRIFWQPAPRTWPVFCMHPVRLKKCGSCV